MRSWVRRSRRLLATNEGRPLQAMLEGGGLAGTDREKLLGSDFFGHHGLVRALNELDQDALSVVAKTGLGKL